MKERSLKLAKIDINEVFETGCFGKCTSCIKAFKSSSRFYHEPSYKIDPQTSHIILHFNFL